MTTQHPAPRGGGSSSSLGGGGNESQLITTIITSSIRTFSCCDGRCTSSGAYSLCRSFVNGCQANSAITRRFSFCVSGQGGCCAGHQLVAFGMHTAFAAAVHSSAFLGLSTPPKVWRCARESFIALALCQPGAPQVGFNASSARPGQSGGRSTNKAENCLTRSFPCLEAVSCLELSRSQKHARLARTG